MPFCQPSYISIYIFDSYLHTPNRLSQSYQTDTFCYGNRLALFQWLAIKCECFHRIIRCPISRLSLVQFSQLQKWCENEWRHWTRASARFHFYLTSQKCAFCFIPWKLIRNNTFNEKFDGHEHDWPDIYGIFDAFVLLWDNNWFRLTDFSFFFVGVSHFKGIEIDSNRNNTDAVSHRIMLAKNNVGLSKDFRFKLASIKYLMFK